MKRSKKLTMLILGIALVSLGFLNLVPVRFLAFSGMQNVLALLAMITGVLMIREIL
ncbi:MAG: hypothetical protein KatS3mg105_4141 [Gemmatales bacterium]|nr:MAG: hypothetical protein KatS3mg105_4141 [Gemmatales bacterium]